MRDWIDRRAFLVAADAVAAIAAMLAAVWLRFGSDTRSVWSELSLPPISTVALGFGVLAFSCFASAGVYRAEIYWDLRDELIDLGRGLVLLGVTSLSALFLFKMDDFSRLAIVLTFIFLLTLTVTFRLMSRRATRRALQDGETTRNWLVVGSAESSNQLEHLLGSHSHTGVSIVGYVGNTGSSAFSEAWLGTIYDIPEILKDVVVDEVIVSGLQDQKDLEAVLSVCAEQGKTVRISMDSLAPTALKGRMEEFSGVPMWSIVSTQGKAIELAMKRLIDVIGSALILAVLSPVMILVSSAIKLSDGGRVLFVQRRSGLHGRQFAMYKFRTMYEGAEIDRDSLLDRNERTGPVFKLQNDPRITPIGKWLRRTSVDELPQLVNVFLGHMSLVGPRPQPLEEVAQYDLWHRRRLSMRPGVTGLWQVRARHDPSFDTWMDNDLEYIDSWSLWLDAWILLKTPVAMVRTPGE